MNLKVKYSVTLNNPDYHYGDLNRKPTVEHGGTGTLIQVLTNNYTSYEEKRTYGVVIDNFSGKFYEVPINKLRYVGEGDEKV